MERGGGHAAIGQGFVKQRTAQANQICGLLGEFDIVIAQGMAAIFRELPEVLEDAENDLSDAFRALLALLEAYLKTLDRQVEEPGREIEQWTQRRAVSGRPARIPWIGPITASALVATIGDAGHFKNGRQLAAWLRLVPKQHGSGGK